MIRDVKIRRAIEEVVYARFCPFGTMIEKAHCQGELGMMLEGFEMALRHVCDYYRNEEGAEKMKLGDFVDYLENRVLFDYEPNRF